MQTKKYSLKDIHATLRTPHTGDGRIPFHPILMMHAAELIHKTYSEFMTNHEVLVESNLECLKLYNHDAVSLISDPYRETSAFGSTITFDGNNSPTASLVVDENTDVDNLLVPDVYSNERTKDRIQGVKLFREKLGPDFPVIGWIEGPLAEASDLAGMGNILLDMMIDPEKVIKITKKTLDFAKQFAEAQINAGANIIGVGDAICSQISPEMYEEFVFKQHVELFEFIQSKGALVKLHICGNISHLLPIIKNEGVDILDVDWMVDMAETHKMMGKDVMLCGNLDPVGVIMNGNEETITATFNRIKSSLPTENWILMGGCEIPRGTSPANMQLLREISLKK